MVEALDKVSKCQLVACAQRSDQLSIVRWDGRSAWWWLETLAHGQAVEDLASLPRPHAAHTPVRFYGTYSRIRPRSRKPKAAYTRSAISVDCRLAV